MGTITDNDELPSLGIDDVSVAEDGPTVADQEGMGTITDNDVLTVTLSDPYDTMRP